jgi:hypothetical protein
MTHALEHVALAADVLFEEEADVTSLSVDVARDVDEGLGCDGNELAEEAFVAALAWGLSERQEEGSERDLAGGREREKKAPYVDDDRRLVPWQAGDRLKDLLALSGLEFALALDPVELCVALGKVDRLGVDLDAGHALEVGRERDGKEARTAVGVDEVRRQRLDDGRRRRLKDGLPDVVGQRGKD